MSKAQEQAQKIADTCRELGWSFTVRGDLLEITKNIKPHDNDDFCQADGEYYSILSLLKYTRPGSMWGTDGGGVGALSAMRNGMFVMKKSGGDKRVLRALSKVCS